MRKRIIAACAVVIGLLTADLSRHPSDQLSTRAAASAIHVYQSTLSPLYERMGIKRHTYREIVWQWFVLNRAPHTDWDVPAARVAASGPVVLEKNGTSRPSRDEATA